MTRKKAKPKVKPKVKKLSDKNIELRDSLDLKDNYATKRHGEKKELILLRQSLALELLDIRDKVAMKRHKERLDILGTKYGK